MLENKEVNPEHNKDCQHDNESKHKHHGHNHGLMMILCLLPMGLFMYYLYSKSTSVNESPWLFAFLILCPIMHLFMMRGMHKHSGDEDVQEQEVDEI
ncbi:DUF2933 domain-containing protein [Haloplasma contractile]|uniref:DUF2933 domain-containing protein n=1 Tax=Haloplasma contractile SSD-17B TaxID=1033810 RepID=F7PW88_9MOLU|nr:DUF2933 domain-containing protein [Haloplasma contractile]ERJ11254.1 hypothetical protein HLPCO_002694 [Haloplasma contractile SSD-17B]